MTLSSGGHSENLPEGWARRDPASLLAGVECSQSVCSSPVVSFLWVAPGATSQQQRDSQCLPWPGRGYK